MIGAVFAALAAMTCAATSQAATPRRIALVIGNSAYQHTAPLSNPANDAEDIARALSALGFEVIKALNLSKAEMDRTLAGLAGTLKGAEMGLFFYAGHGLQVSGQNYLVPVDAKLESPSGLEFEAVRLDTVQRIMENETQTNVLILDACRDNPLTRNLARGMGTRSSAIGKGLAPQESGAGTIISYSTQPGNVALDGAGGRNSPFAQALVKHLPSKGRGLASVFVNVRNDVMTATSRRQVPWEHSALTSDIVLAPEEAAAAAREPPPPAPAKEVVAALPQRRAGADDKEKPAEDSDDDASGSPKALTIEVPKKKLVYGLKGAVRFHTADAFNNLGECTVNYADQSNPKMTRVAMKIGDYFDFTASDSKYRAVLSDVQNDVCTLEVTLVGAAKNPYASGASKY